MGNFTRIRNGLYGHIKAGRMSPFDLGIYVFLHLRVSWTTGTYQGCALTIACDFGDPKLKEHIQKSLRRLRDRGYINYPKGNGSRGGYPILINKYEPTAGELLGTRLNAWKNGDLCQPEYEPKNGDRTVAERKRRGSGTVVTPFQDLKILQDMKDEQDGTTAMPRVAERRGTRIPLDFVVTN